jgi:hypothetical protein
LCWKWIEDFWEVVCEESDVMYLSDIAFRLTVFLGSHTVYTGTLKRTSGVTEETLLKRLRDPF